MEAMNRAIEDVADFGEFKRRMMARMAFGSIGHSRDEKVEEAPRALPESPRRPGENREQHRHRLRAARESAAS